MVQWSITLFFLKKLWVNVLLVLCLFSEVTMAQGEVVTSWEILYLDRAWATEDDDDDDVWTPEASHPHEGGGEVKKKICLMASWFVLLDCFHTYSEAGASLSPSSTSLFLTVFWCESHQQLHSDHQWEISSNTVRMLPLKPSEIQDF